MSHSTRSSRAFLPAAVLIPALAAVALTGVAAPALAASHTPTTCRGWLSKAATSDEPNNLSYQFQCTWGVSAYTVIANRLASDFGTIDDFSASPTVVDESGTVVLNEGVSCQGTLPGNGVNCNVTPGSWIAAPNWAEGSIDLADPFCSNVPPGSAPGALPEPQAVVQLVVTDTSGVAAGPFRLPLNARCPATRTSKLKARSKPRGKKHAAVEASGRERAADRVPLRSNAP